MFSLFPDILKQTHILETQQYFNSLLQKNNTLKSQRFPRYKLCFCVFCRWASVIGHSKFDVAPWLKVNPNKHFKHFKHSFITLFITPL